MRAITYKQLLDRAGLLCGIQPAQLQNEDAATLGVGLNQALRHAWEFAFWPEVTDTDEFRYRADYAAGTTYAAGDQVWDPTTAAYYEAAQASTGEAVTDTDYWTPLGSSDWDIYVPWGTGPLAEGSMPRRCMAEDPRVKPWTPDLDFSISADGIHPLRNVPPSLWIEYRRPCPDWEGAAYSAAATYAAGEQVYFDNDFHRCVTATSAGESPTSAPAKWVRLEIPWRFGDYAAHSAAAEKLRPEGQTEKAIVEQTKAEDRLYDQLVLHETQTRQQRRFRAF
jgi:hypothetical protein